MADSQSGVSSSVAPGDSVSSRGGKKSKPGKSERAARRVGQGSQPGLPASATKASQFAAGFSSDPVPTPGKYPVVFQTGAGEPTRDLEYSYDHEAIRRVIGGFGDRYVRNARYAEFKAHSGLTDGQFKSYIAVATLLGLAQQTVHSHVNMGLPQGDFAPVSSSEVLNFAAVRAYVTQFGEFSVPSTGTRYMLADYQSTVSRLVFAAQQCMRNGTHGPVMDRMWLPMSSSDRSTKVVLAARLNGFLSNMDLAVTDSVLEDAVMSGTVPDVWEALKPQFGDESVRDRFDFLFRHYADVAQFTVAFTTPAASAVLAELSLAWATPSAGHLDWSFNPKQSFSSLADAWAKVSSTYAQFFEMGSGIAGRASARGSEAQMVDVRTTDGVTIVKTYLALSAPAFSLSACFPPECIFVGGIGRRVIMTTSVSVSQRATEFCLRDWK